MTASASLRRFFREARRAACLLLCALMTLPLTGCWSQRELGELAIVVGTALDVGDRPDTLKLTAQVVKAAAMGGLSSSQGSSGDKAYINISNIDESALAAVRGITHEQSRRLYFAHNEVIIFSSELAKLDMAGGLDAFTREYETRLNVNILISRGKASEILEEDVLLEKVPAIHIFGMMKNQKLNSETMVVTLRDFIIATLSGSTAPVAPFVETYETEDGKKRARLEGTAVFKGGKLIGELDTAQTRGLLWVTDKAQSGVRTVDTPSGQVVLEILHTKSSLNPSKAEDGTIRMELTIQVDGTIQSNETAEPVSRLKTVELLKELLKEGILSDVEGALAQARTLSADVFGFGEEIRLDDPAEWDEMKANWDQVFPQIQLDIQVEADLRSTGGLSKPVVPGGAK